MTDDIEKSQRVWDAVACRYDASMAWFERMFMRDGREWACSLVPGAVLEVGIGTGLNLPFYGADVRLSGIDVSPAMVGIAHERAVGLGMDVRLGVADARALPFSDEQFDGVVSTLTLCAVPDEEAVLGEIARVLRPSGKLLLVDHIGSSWPPVWMVQRVVEFATIRSAGEHMTRRPSRLLDRLGFTVLDRERSKLGIMERVSAVKR